jgi:hypothetical protein
MIQLFLASRRTKSCSRRQRALARPNGSSDRRTYRAFVLGLAALLAVSCGDDGPKSRKDGGGILGAGAPGRGVPVAGGDAGAVPGPGSDAGSTVADAGGLQTVVDSGGPGQPTDASTTRPGSGDASVTDEQFFAKLRGCGLLGTGRTSTSAPASSPVDECVRPCLLSATCQELSLYLCSESLTGSFAACATACIPRCVGGTSTGDTPDFCDGVAQCRDGSDELGCDRFYFVCKNGTKTTRDFTCDGEDDCGDGSDELGCAPSFACGAGDEPVPARYVCDQEADCSNASDETGCAAYICS